MPLYPPSNTRAFGTTGKGEDYHYHGDFFGDKCMYSEKNYTEGPAGHPPFIGWAADGYLIHGRYTLATQAGVDEDLDECGGHEHAGWPYHYHPSVQQDMVAINPSYRTKNFTAYWIAPKYCFAGNVSAQPAFWTPDSEQWNYDRKFPADVAYDIDQVRPT